MATLLRMLGTQELIHDDFAMTVGLPTGAALTMYFAYRWRHHAMLDRIAIAAGVMAIVIFATLIVREHQLHSTASGWNRMPHALAIAALFIYGCSSALLIAAGWCGLKSRR